MLAVAELVRWGRNAVGRVRPIRRVGSPGCLLRQRRPLRLCLGAASRGHPRSPPAHILFNDRPQPRVRACPGIPVILPDRARRGVEPGRRDHRRRTGPPQGGRMHEQQDARMGRRDSSRLRRPPFALDRADLGEGRVAVGRDRHVPDALGKAGQQLPRQGRLRGVPDHAAQGGACGGYGCGSIGGGHRAILTRAARDASMKTGYWTARFNVATGPWRCVRLRPPVRACSALGAWRRVSPR